MTINKKRWMLAQDDERRHWDIWKNIVKEHWDLYKNIVKEYWNLHLRFMKRYVDLKSGDTILDIGCGPWGMINYIDKGDRYGLDSLMDYYLLNFEMPRNINFLKGMGEDVPFKNECFDIVIATNTLDHTKDPKRMLEEIRKVLRKNGILFLTTNCYGPLYRMRREVMERLGRGDKLHPHSLSFWRVEELMVKSKFHVKVIRSGIGDLGDYSYKRLVRRYKEIACRLGRDRFRFEWKPRFIIKIIDNMIGPIEKRIGYHKDFLFIATKGEAPN